jgi:hypothetical protein
MFMLLRTPWKPTTTSSVVLHNGGNKEKKTRKKKNVLKIVPPSFMPAAKGRARTPLGPK